MNTLAIIYMSVKAIFKQNIKQTILSTIGIVIGIASVITVVSIGRSFENFTIENLTGKDEMGTRITVNFYPENEEQHLSNFELFNEHNKKLITNVAKTEQVSLVKIKSDVIQVEYQLENDNSDMIDVKSADKKLDITYGREMNDTDNLTQSKYTIIPSSIGDASDVGKTIALDNQLFTITGIYKEDDHLLGDGITYIPKSTFEAYFGGSDVIAFIEFYIKDPQQVKKTIAKVEQKLEEEGSKLLNGTYDVTNTSDVSGGVSKLLSVSTTVIALIAGISLFIAGVGIMNMMYTSVSERKHEIGMKRALGATQKQIMLQFLLEGVFITVLGGVLGLLLGIISSNLMSILFPFVIYIDLFIIFLAIGIAILVGILFSFVPARNASHQNIITTLK